MASLPREALQAAADAHVVIRRMVEADVPKVAESERLGYAFPWSEGIFRDCIRAGYHCRVMEVDEQFAAYAVLSTGAKHASLPSNTSHHSSRVFWRKSSSRVGRSSFHLAGLRCSPGAGARPTRPSLSMSSL